MSIPQYPETHLERYLDVMAGGKGPLPDEPENHLEVYLDYILGGSRQPEFPESRIERYLDKMAGLSEITPTQPETRIERYLSVAVGGEGTKPTDPETRTERYLDGIADNPPRKAADNTNDTSADVPVNSLAVARIDRIGGQTIKDGTNPLKYSKPTSIDVGNINLFDIEKWFNDNRISFTKDNEGFYYITLAQSLFNYAYKFYGLKNRYMKFHIENITSTNFRIGLKRGNSIIANYATNYNDTLIENNFDGVFFDWSIAGDVKVKITIADERFTDYIEHINTNYFQSEISLIKSRLESLGHSPDVLGYSNGKTGAAWDGNYIDLVSGKVYIKYVSYNMGLLDWNSYQHPTFGSYWVSYISDLNMIPISYSTKPYNCILNKYNVVPRNASAFVNGTYCIDGDVTRVLEMQIKDDTYTNRNDLKASLNGVPIIYETKDIIVIDVSDIIKGGRVNVEPGGTVALNTTENAGHMNITWIKNGPDPVALMAAPVSVLSDQENNLMESEVIENGKEEFEPLENLASEEDLPYISMDFETSNGLDQDA